MYFDPVKTGRRIKYLRKSQGLTQEQLSTLLNISDRYLRTMEAGIRAGQQHLKLYRNVIK